MKPSRTYEQALLASRETVAKLYPSRKDEIIRGDWDTGESMRVAMKLAGFPLAPDRGE